MLQLGLFGANCSSGRTYVTLPERWVASWENNLKLAQMADEIGIECMVPIARWKGYGPCTTHSWRPSRWPRAITSARGASA